MTTATDIQDKCIEIEIEIAKGINLCESASKPYWTEGDADYSDMKTICLPIADTIAALIVDLNVLTSP